RADSRRARAFTVASVAPSDEIARGNVSSQPGLPSVLSGTWRTGVGLVANSSAARLGIFDTTSRCPRRAQHDRVAFFGVAQTFNVRPSGFQPPFPQFPVSDSALSRYNHPDGECSKGSHPRHRY